MKQKLLTLGMVLGTLFLSSMSASAWTFDFETLTAGSESIKEYEGKYSPVSTPSAFGADGVVYQTGLYDDVVMIGDELLENVATSAYIAAVAPGVPSAFAKWAVGIKGAAKISQIVVDGDYIYVAGTFADDVVFGSKGDATEEYSGVEESHDMVNAFIAKYNTNGVLQGVLPIYPHANTKYPDKYTEGSDMMVNPTALVVQGGKVYVSFTFRGGFTAGSVDVNGNLFAGEGLVYDALCLDVIAWDGTNVENVLTFKGDKDVVSSNFGPFSIGMTSDAKGLHVGIMAANANTLTVGETSTDCIFDKDIYGALMVRIADEVTTKQFTPTSSERLYVSNIIKKMFVNDGKLYVVGNVSTPVPFNDTVVPDLWSDQFVACLDASSYDVKWAAITGAKRDDMPDMNAKYRETTDATIYLGNVLVVGSTNFAVTDEGVMMPVATSEDYCLGISCDGTLLAETKKIANGSQLLVYNPLVDAVENVKVAGNKEVKAVYSVDGTQRQELQKGFNIVKYSDGTVEKQYVK